MTSNEDEYQKCLVKYIVFSPLVFWLHTYRWR